MEFLNPALLWGLLGLSIPIAIHLLQLKRYKTVLFSDIRFLKNIQKSSRKQQQIRHWIILLLRMLMWSLLTLAFALPFFNSSEDTFKKKGRIVIAIDNSPSMNLKGENAPLWAQAKEAAYSILAANPQAEIMVVSANSQNFGFQNATAAKLEINRVSPSSAEFAWDDILNRLSTYRSTDTTQVYLLTDGQISTMGSLDSSSTPIEVLPILFNPVGTQSNLSLDSAWLTSPILLKGQNVELEFQVVNTSDETVETNVELYVNGEWSGVQTLALEGGTDANSSFGFQAESESLEIELIIEDGALSFDNSYYLFAETTASSDVLWIHDTKFDGLRMDSVIRDSSYHIDEALFESIPFGSFSDYDLVVVDRTSNWPGGLASALEESAQNGTAVLVFPEGPSAENLLELGTASFGNKDTSNIDDLRIRPSQGFYSGVFYEEPKNLRLPALDVHYPISPNYATLGGVALIDRANGTPSLVQYPTGQGFIYQWNSHPAQQQIGRSELYTVILYQMCIYRSRGRWNAMNLGSNDDFIFNSKAGSEDIIRLTQDSLAIIPNQRSFGSSMVITPRTELFSPGFATVELDGEMIAKIALNVNRRESDLTRYEGEEISLKLDKVGIPNRVQEVDNTLSSQEYISQLGTVRSSSHWWILSAIIVLILEMILWRRPKT